MPETKVVNQDYELIEPKKETSSRLGSKTEHSKRVDYEHRKRDYEHVPDGQKSRIKFNHGGSQMVRYDSSKQDDKNLPEGWNSIKDSYHKDLPEGWTVKSKVVIYAAPKDIDANDASKEKFENDNEYQVYQKGKSDVEFKSTMVDTKLPKTKICNASKGFNIKVKRKCIDKGSKKHVVMMNDKIDKTFTRDNYKENFTSLNRCSFS